ncbi:MAG: hypothetical protein ACLQPD_16865 [Desulfomonilaceae bacterium]
MVTRLDYRAIRGHHIYLFGYFDDAFGPRFRHGIDLAKPIRSFKRKSSLPDGLPVRASPLSHQFDKTE